MGLTKPRNIGPRVLFAGGGTGGHVYPAIAIANALKALDPKASIAFAGTKEKMEWTAVPQAGYPIYDISISGFPRKLSLGLLKFPFKLLKGLKDSFELIGGFRPDVVVGTGGYVSGPVLWAANRRKIPTLIQEQNAFAGATNKMLGKNAKKIFLAFKEAGSYFPEKEWVVSGNPVRSIIHEADPLISRRHFGIAQRNKVLFIFGGSLGSVALNNGVLEIIGDLLKVEDLSIIWQTGNANFESLRDALANRLAESGPSNIEDEKSIAQNGEVTSKVSDRIKLLPYIDRMELAYGAADLVLCRAGAITCSELMMTAKPSVLVPLPSAAEDHQTHNAIAMGEAAVMVKQSDMSANLSSEILELLADKDRRRSMSDAARSMAQPNAAAIIAEGVVQLARIDDSFANSSAEPSDSEIRTDDLDKSASNE